MTRIKDGREWLIGTAADVAWIEAGLSRSGCERALIPPVFEAYCRVEMPSRTQIADPTWECLAVHHRAIVDVLSAASSCSVWWLGYLETGIGYDMVFYDAPRTELFTWDYVLVQAGPEQALSWRAKYEFGFSWKGSLPDLIFPTDHSWLLVTAWDDYWTGIGGSEELVQRFLDDPELGPRAKRLVRP